MALKLLAALACVLVTTASAQNGIALGSGRSAQDLANAHGATVVSTMGSPPSAPAAQPNTAQPATQPAAVMAALNVPPAANQQQGAATVSPRQPTAHPTKAPPVPTHQPPMPKPEECMGIVEVVCSTPNLSILCDALDTVGITTLDAQGTFFAPTNAAFEAPSMGNFELLDVLLYHGLTTTEFASDLANKNNMLLDTLQGCPVQVSVTDEGSIFINQAKVIQPFDIVVCEGVAHVIDSLLLPTCDESLPPMVPPPSPPAPSAPAVAIASQTGAGDAVATQAGPGATVAGNYAAPFGR